MRRASEESIDWIVVAGVGFRSELINAEFLLVLYWVLLLWYSLILSMSKQESSMGRSRACFLLAKERNLLHRRGILVAKLVKIPTSLSD